MKDWEMRGKVAQHVFETIGSTPLVKLNKVSQGINADILGKLEWFSPTGSLKDRIYYQMITQAIKNQELKPGMEILETSTGNAGIACAFVGGLLGYPVTIILPDGMSAERAKIMQAYGAKVIYTPGAESDVDLCLIKQEEIIIENPGKYWVPSQYTNQ
ncbi:MAG: pyridoxal-phosphate dependent enzyme, partial [Dehalococcoidia bacterium]|nr:pyridoxal-phosphate dependent enzyme [Dehalococcoidia bacterium]